MTTCQVGKPSIRFMCVRVENSFLRRAVFGWGGTVRGACVTRKICPPQKVHLTEILSTCIFQPARHENRQERPQTDRQTGRELGRMRCRRPTRAKPHAICANFCGSKVAATWAAWPPSASYGCVQVTPHNTAQQCHPRNPGRNTSMFPIPTVPRVMSSDSQISWNFRRLLCFRTAKKGGISDNFVAPASI